MKKSSRSSRRSKPITFREYVELLLRKWQKILRLQDWDLSVKVVRSFEVPSHGIAATHICENFKEAHITLRDPDDAPSEPTWLGDDSPELSIVHELMHIKLQPLVGDQEDLSTVDIEQFVEQMARVLVLLDQKEAEK